MYKWTLKQKLGYTKTPIKVAGGFVESKKSCLFEALHYLQSYSSEEFSKMILTIERVGK